MRKAKIILGIAMAFAAMSMMPLDNGCNYPRRGNRIERKTQLTPKQKKAREKSMRAKKARRKQRKMNKK